VTKMKIKLHFNYILILARSYCLNVLLATHV
jgi:hypothetical protein